MSEVAGAPKVFPDYSVTGTIGPRPRKPWERPLKARERRAWKREWREFVASFDRVAAAGDVMAVSFQGAVALLDGLAHRWRLPRNLQEILERGESIMVTSETAWGRAILGELLEEMRNWEVEE